MIRVSRKYAICLDMLGLLLIFVSLCDSRYSSSAFVWHVLSCADHDDNDDGRQVCPESFGLNMAPNRHRLSIAQCIFNTVYTCASGDTSNDGQNGDATQDLRGAVKL